MVDVYSHIMDVKNYGMETVFLQKWRSNLFRMFEQNTKYLNFSQVQEVGSRVIIQVNNLILTFLSCYYVMEGSFSLGTLFAVQYLIGTSNAPLVAIADFMNQTQLTLISLQRIQAFNHKPSDVLNENTNIIPRYKDLSIQNISFRYPNGKIALSQISMFMKYGGKYGIIGSSGCGKSTLLKIINGIFEPTVGLYSVGSSNSHALGYANMRSFISACLQENIVFRGTILENIIGGNPYDENRLIKVVEVACIRREIETLSISYDTHIGDDGINLSKGQQQRLLIARTLYKKAEVYLFDEITNYLDEVMRNKIISKIDDFLADKTRIYVSHHTEFLKDASLIYCLHSGCLIDFGSFNDLVERKRII